MVSLNKLRVNALLDTGSTVTLVDSNLMKNILVKGSKLACGPMLKLCGADGKELQNDGCYSIKITINSTNFWHNVIFIKNVQVPCILGMNFLSKAGNYIDTATNTIQLGKSKLARGKTYSVYPIKNITLPAKSESLVTLTAPKAFDQGLVEGSIRLPENAMLMEGVVTSKMAKTFSAVLANFHHLPIKLTKNDKVVRLHLRDEKPQLVKAKDFNHVDKIPFHHIPLKFQADYRALLRSYSDVFSKKTPGSRTLQRFTSPSTPYRPKPNHGH